jgi:hypothetical protein
MTRPDFNKAKTLSAAEKYVMQGKIPAAILEYEKILQNEPRDLNCNHTIPIRARSARSM